jgi:glycosyltransferase involved in cell wall biosynthesis
MAGRAPKVSIGVPVYNDERYLGETIQSLLAQTFEDFELIICDNASTDRTAEIARDYAARDSRIRYARNERNLGAARNYGRCFALAGGEYFRWFAGDDLAARESLARCVDVLDRDRGVVLAYPRTRLIDGQGRPLGDYEDRLHLQSPHPVERFRELLSRLGLCNAFYGLMRAGAVRRTGLLGSYIGSDVVFQAELVLHGTFWEIPEPLFFRRMHAAASSSMTPLQRLQFYSPERKRHVALTQWRHLLGLVRAVQRAPIDVRDKLRLHGFLARTAVWQRQELGREALLVTRQFLNHLFRTPSGRW